ncbi:MAG: tetratricopeptide repeat protein [Deltaproteobacteria bacterium]|nr:tetratricopeptide repeat protein [Deltaproteobacteria bacterium]
MTDDAPITRRCWWYLALAVVTFAAYATSIDKPFLWDDEPFILYETAHQSLANIPKYFTRDQHYLYRPVREVAYTLTYAAFGHSPVGYRTVAIAFHVLVTLLFASIVRRMGAPPVMALPAGFLFGVHPVHADRVANTTGAFDLVGMVFGFAALRFLLLFRDTGKNRHLAIAAPLLAVGLLGSEECVTIPVLYAAVCWLFDERPPGETALARVRRLALRRKLWIGVALVIAYIALRTHILGRVERVSGAEVPPLFDRLATTSVALWHGVAKLFAPFGLRPAYWDPVHRFTSPWTWIAAAGVVAVLVWLWRSRGKSSWPAMGAAWYLVAFIPFANVIPIGTYFAERYLYAPLGGFAIAAAYLATRPALWRQPAARVLVGAALALMVVMTLHRGYVWSEARRLWEDAYAKDDRAGLVLVNVATQRRHADPNVDNCPLYRRGMAYAPYGGPRYETLIGMGECRIADKNLEEAEQFFRQAIAKTPARFEGYQDLAQLMAMTGRWNEAQAAAEDLLDREPDSLVGHYVMGYIFLRNGMEDEAKTALGRALASKQEFPQLREQATQWLAALERPAEDAPDAPPPTDAD